MAKLYLRISIIMYLSSAVLFLQAFALTDPSDVAVLQDLYMSLKQPPQLVGWNLSGGDPCEEAWKGISCSGSSVIIIKLNGLELTGSLGGNLSDLLQLKQLDFSHNYIEGEVPMSLPPNATHIDLSCNNFKNTNLSLESMKYLEHLNLSHNSISGPLGNTFTGFPNLKQMDLSHNKFTGNLPSTFESLTNLKSLFLQNNEFNGSVSVLVPLALHELDFRTNRFNARPGDLSLLPQPQMTDSEIAEFNYMFDLKERERRFKGRHSICPVLPIPRSEYERMWPEGMKFANAKEAIQFEMDRARAREIDAARARDIDAARARSRTGRSQGPSGNGFVCRR
ncbi:hypothetical protein C5167_047104 [Papaver somniferum]|uniref:Leucine-rich repeat-containing N-terminal plant-type domain-containing protein n=1 Tax=Papaver somniferum TaxID=3469 RepID=A0A4Y7LJG6_PAPSO|nr:protein STRUBBELIG-RECEPTOR FAMILY 2-like [Papaver somniferum]XP_026427919.1 protein STRUBBELIG-RECEPTOR FAMILY 2-like [Papaver somniferum]XP_026427920.1 protein STRUBBELIG-RECEPTOR FAMILY 2-like [Papaver somniferum]XP_026427921.1 protein STRUBBELIG-RECEPTOR FAMILY 2-like [Papaver somniferum]RZC84319.1 hypothetical protein C5167_047104 [Papaver somniferum]